MAKNVVINGVTYSNVPYVSIPMAEGQGSAKFVDTDSGDAASRARRMCLCPGKMSAFRRVSMTPP